ncbi:hypothetical protein R1flu_003223 [Riccia fluitans]|uniref:Aminotransferase-like plant mobile domain-containing protein n=1 Tax=Riccia fluitans TaxID=41844 RepID=A0ABD1Y8D5_9MARC
MATWSEKLRRLTLFDGEAELTPELRLAWQQNMELRTKFVRYPGPRSDGLHPIHFWFLEHYGLLPYFLQMQAEGIPAKVFFSIVSTCRYVTVAERTEHLELRGLNGQRLVVTPEVVREAFGIPWDTARDEEQGATWPNQAPKEPAGVPLQIINDYLLCKASSGPNPSCRYNLLAVSAFLRLTYYRLVNWAHILAGGLASAVKEYVQKFSGGTGKAVVMVNWAPGLMKIIKHNRALLFGSPFNCVEPWEIYADCFGSYEQADVLWEVQEKQWQKTRCPGCCGRQELSRSSSPEQPPRKEPRVEKPPQQAKGWQEDTAIPGFEPSDDELPIGTLRRDISRLRQEVQRTEPLVIRDVGGEGPAGRQESSHMGGQTVSAPEPPRRL